MEKSNREEKDLFITNLPLLETPTSSIRSSSFGEMSQQEPIEMLA